MSTKTLLITTPEERKAILSHYNKNEEILAEDVSILRNWVKTQPHLPEVMCDERLTRFLLNNKFSIERTKEKIDMYYTIRNLIPEFYNDTNPKLPHMKEVAKAVFICPLPHLTKDLHRVQIMRINEDIDFVERFNPNHFFMHTYHFAEVRCVEDFYLSTILVYDFKGITMGHISKINPMHLKRAAAVMEKVYSNRVAAIHFLNSSTLIENFFVMLKTLLNQKLSERIFLHKDELSLADEIDRRILPKDYGGDEMSLAEIQGLWAKKIEEYEDRFDALDTLRVNEKLRPEKLVNDDILGFHGNFKALRVD